MARNTEGREAFCAATLGKTDTEVAFELSTPDRPVSQPVVNRWRRGERTPDSDFRDRIEDVYDVSRRLWSVDIGEIEGAAE